MKKEGLAIIILVIALSIFTGTIPALISTFVILFGVYLILVILAAGLKNCAKPVPKPVKMVTTGSYEMTTLFPPSNFYLLETEILTRMGIMTESFPNQSMMFLQLVGVVNNTNNIYKPCYSNAVIKKLMYEWQRKYGDLDVAFFSDKKRITINEALRRLDPGELDEFNNFCVVQSI